MKPDEQTQRMRDRERERERVLELSIIIILCRNLGNDLPPDWRQWLAVSLCHRRRHRHILTFINRIANLIVEKGFPRLNTFARERTNCPMFSNCSKERNVIRSMREPQ